MTNRIIKKILHVICNTTILIIVMIGEYTVLHYIYQYFTLNSVLVPLATLLITIAWVGFLAFNKIDYLNYENK